MKLLGSQRVDVQLAETSPLVQPLPYRPLSRAQRAHWRFSWAERLARNVVMFASPCCGLKPREIVRFCPQEWSEAQEIYRRRRNTIERLQHQADRLQWLLR